MLAATGLSVLIPLIAIALLAGALLLARRRRQLLPGEYDPDGDGLADSSDGDVVPDPRNDGSR